MLEPREHDAPMTGQLVVDADGHVFGPCDPIPALRDIEFVGDCIRAYNDWIAEFCSAAPDRLFGVAAVPLQDPERAVHELERAVEELALCGAFIRPSAYVDELPLN